MGLTGAQVALISRKGNGMRGETISIKWLSSSLPYSMAVAVASLKVDLRATKRNLVKRRIKNAVKPYLIQIKFPVNIVLFSSKNTLSKDFWGIKREIEDLFKKARLL